MTTMLRQDSYISRIDRQKLERIIRVALSQLHRDTSYLQHLDTRLQNARLVHSTDMPADVVTMNSRVKLRFEDGTSHVYALVYPEHADVAAGRLSVLAPLGAALLGASEDDKVHWETPDGERSVVVEAILYQPEAQGDYHL